MKRSAFLLVLAMVLMACGTTRKGISYGKKAGSSVKVRKAAVWSSSITKRCERVQSLINQAAKRHDLDRGLIAGIIRVESAFNPTARSHVGARGLMQVMPANGRALKCGNLNNPSANIECGAKVLKGFLKYYKDNVIYALSGYNAGFRMPNKARKAKGLPKNYWYVERVLSARTAFLRDGCG